MQILKNPNFDFLKWRWHAVVLSLILIAIGAVLFMTRGINFGIDFAGGANIVLKFQGAVPLNQLRAELPDAQIQQYGPANENSVLIRLPQQQTERDYAGEIVEQLHTKLNPQAAQRHDVNYVGSDRLAALMAQADPDNRGTTPAASEYYNTIADRIIEKRSELGIFTTMQQVTSVQGVTTGIARVLNEQVYLGQFNVLSQETVGPQVGSELQQKAFWALVLSALAMGVYIWVRFDLVFGFAALVCLVHDVLIAMSFLLVMQLEFSLNIVAALLTLVGYSINDTVVTYDRVRENKRKIKKPMTMAEHLNLAMNQTLSRTILTSGTVLVVLIPMLLFGGEVIRGFSWILTVGVLSGTYSTLFIVPAVAVAWDNRSRRRQPAPAPARVQGATAEPAVRKR